MSDLSIGETLRRNNIAPGTQHALGELALARSYYLAAADHIANAESALNPCPSNDTKSISFSDPTPPKPTTALEHAPASPNSYSSNPS